MGKYGFIYIWLDVKHNRYYVGSHWGTENDGYICSSRWMRKAYKRRQAWNKGLKGEKSHVKGRVLSEETRRKISEAHKGRTQPTGSGMKGRRHSEETKLKISKSKRM